MRPSACVLILNYAAYDPDEEDVFSFISVFDSNNDGKI
jgi:hypothetical protein